MVLIVRKTIYLVLWFRDTNQIPAAFLTTRGPWCVRRMNLCAVRVREFAEPKKHPAPFLIYPTGHSSTATLLAKMKDQRKRPLVRSSRKHWLTNHKLGFLIKKPQAYGSPSNHACISRASRSHVPLEFFIQTWQHGIFLELRQRPS